MKILTLNCGSSSVKYMLYDREAQDVKAKGIVERIAIGASFCTHEVSGKESINICEGVGVLTEVVREGDGMQVTPDDLRVADLDGGWFDPPSDELFRTGEVR